MLGYNFVSTDKAHLFSHLDKVLEEKHYSPNADVRHVRMAGIDLWIPNNYKMGSYDNAKLEQKSVLLQFLLPDFEPRTKMNRSEFTSGTGWQNRAQILLNDTTKSTDLQFQFNATLELQKQKVPFFSDYEGLESMLIANKNADEIDDRYRRFIEKKLFYTRDADQIVRYIICRHLAPASGCSHYFEDQGILFKFSYSMKNLKNWKPLEEQALNLVNTFKTKKPHHVNDAEDD